MILNYLPYIARYCIKQPAKWPPGVMGEKEPLGCPGFTKSFVLPPVTRYPSPSTLFTLELGLAFFHKHRYAFTVILGGLGQEHLIAVHMYDGLIESSDDLVYASLDRLSRQGRAGDVVRRHQAGPLRMRFGWRYLVEEPHFSSTLEPNLSLLIIHRLARADPTR